MAAGAGIFEEFEEDALVRCRYGTHLDGLSVLCSSSHSLRLVTLHILDFGLDVGSNQCRFAVGLNPKLPSDSVMEFPTAYPTASCMRMIVTIRPIVYQHLDKETSTRSDLTDLHRSE